MDLFKFSKTFDIVSHTILIDKLKWSSWIDSLTDRCGCQCWVPSVPQHQSVLSGPNTIVESFVELHNGIGLSSLSYLSTTYLPTLCPNVNFSQMTWNLIWRYARHGLSSSVQWQINIVISERLRLYTLLVYFLFSWEFIHVLTFWLINQCIESWNGSYVNWLCRCAELKHHHCLSRVVNDTNSQTYNWITLMTEIADCACSSHWLWWGLNTNGLALLVVISQFNMLEIPTDTQMHCTSDW